MKAIFMNDREDNNNNGINYFYKQWTNIYV